MTQRNGETADLFISWFKKMRNGCKIHFLETEYMNMVQRGLDIELRKKNSKVWNLDVFMNLQLR